MSTKTPLIAKTFRAQSTNYLRHQKSIRVLAVPGVWRWERWERWERWGELYRRGSVAHDRGNLRAKHKADDGAEAGAVEGTVAGWW